MIKALIFINGCFLKKRATTSMIYSAIPRRAIFKALYAALLILTREKPFSSINVLPLTSR
jgi:hypothetical protein